MAVARVPAFVDTFDSSISASYTNGPSSFDAMEWVAGGFIRAPSAGIDTCIIRNAGVFCPDQYATITVNATTAAGSDVRTPIAVVRGSTTGTAQYQGGIDSRATGAKYVIWEVDAGFGFTRIAEAGTGATVGSGTTATLEVEGAALRLYTDEGGGETLRLSVSDATITGGMPGCACYAEGSATGIQITALAAGSLFQVVDDYLVAIGPYTSGTGNVTPQIPTVLNDAADYFPLLLAHCPGGQNIVLGTANGFSELANSPSATGATTAGVKVAAFGNTSGAGGSDPIITDPGDHCGALIALVWHPDGQPVVDATGNNQKASASTAFSISGVTTTVADALVLPVSGRDTDSAAAAYSGQTNANLTGLAKLFDAGTTQGNGGGLGIFAGIKSTAGAVGATTGTVSNSINADYCIAFKPFVSGGGGFQAAWARGSNVVLH